MGRKSRKKQIRNSDVYRKEMMNLANHLLDKASGPPCGGAKQWEEFVEIYTLVENIREKQAGMGREEVPRDECVEPFMSWLKANAVKTDHVQVENYGHKGFGLTAVQNIKVKSDLFKIPRKVMLTTETAKASVLGNVISKDRVLQAMPNILLSVYLLCEKLLPESFWMPYIKMLPRQYTTPLYFTVDELKLMKGSPSIEDALKQYKNIARQYAYFYKLFQSLPESTKVPLREHFLFDDYRWAVSTVMTRQNQIPSVDSYQTTTALVPLWDMCNHINGSVTTGFDLASNSLQCNAMKDFKVGEELCIFYGTRSNADMLIHDGFIFPENENDKTSIKLGVSKNDSLFAMKAEILARLGLSVSRDFFLSCSARAVPPDLLAFLRVFAMNEDELKERMGSDKNLKLLYNPDVTVSVENEIKLWTFLDTRLSLLLKMYKTTIQEDEATLDKGDLSEHVKLIIQLLLSEKKILQHAREYGQIRKELAPKLPHKLPKIVEEEEENIANTEQQVNSSVDTSKGTATETSPDKTETVNGKQELYTNQEKGTDGSSSEAEKTGTDTTITNSAKEKTETVPSISAEETSTGTVPSNSAEETSTGTVPSNSAEATSTETVPSNSAEEKTETAVTNSAEEKTETVPSHSAEEKSTETIDTDKLVNKLADTILETRSENKQVSHDNNCNGTGTNTDNIA